jgi:hypothetical protein
MRVAINPGPDKSGTLPLYVFLSRHGHKILALIPLAWLLWVVIRYAVPVPSQNQW